VARRHCAQDTYCVVFATTCRFFSLTMLAGIYAKIAESKIHMSASDDAENENMKPKRIFVTADITAEDAERLKKAFADGKLKAFGISNISFAPIHQDGMVSSSWAEGGPKRTKDNDAEADLPPR
jgi:hypothetical protein